MRNFEERKAEIFRRSEERINERRKNRRRIVACCVPLCLCIAVLTAIYIPKKKEKSGSTNNYGYSQPAEEFPYTSLELVGNNTELSNTADIKDIYEIINSAFETDSALSDQSDGRALSTAQTNQNHSETSTIQTPYTPLNFHQATGNRQFIHYQTILLPTKRPKPPSLLAMNS